MFLSVNIQSLVNNYSVRRVSKRNGNDKIDTLSNGPMNINSYGTCDH